MKCHYEVLNVPRDADSSEIKSSYKKLALKWHPDKNPDDPETAKEQFQLVQQAYEILSDPQERAWYDKHREQILRGSNYEDNCLDVFQYFTTTCFKGYDDDEKGFYTVYRNVFDKIIEEDLEFMEDKEELEKIPRFGYSYSDYDEVVGPFYNYWQSYCTKKSYVWLDPYNINEAKDRRILKLIEKENKKVRQKAKKERNEEIRNLVAFVRKRDKRVQEHQRLLEERIKENRLKQLEISKQKRIERKKELDKENHQAEWAKFHNVESELLEIEKNLAEEFGENSDEDENDDLYCIACDKFFKTEKAMKNHESSKKHKENVKCLKDSMLEEDTFENNENVTDDDDEEKEELNKSKNDLSVEENNDILGDDNNSVSDEEEIEKTKRKKKKAKAKNVIKLEDQEHENINLGHKLDSTDDDFDFNTKKNKKTIKKNKNKITTPNGLEKLENNESKDKERDSKIKDKRNNQETGETIDLNHCCATCKSEFQSKNKLFDHLKKTGHGVPTKVKNKLKK